MCVGVSFSRSFILFCNMCKDFNYDPVKAMCLPIPEKVQLASSSHVGSTAPCTRFHTRRRKLREGILVIPIIILHHLPF